MIRFKEFLKEGNKLASKIWKPLSKGEQLATVSAERGQMSGKQKKEAHSKIEKDLQHLRTIGAIKGWKSAAGRYKYDSGEKDIAKEKSYVVRSGDNPKKSRHFMDIVKALGNRHGQESIMGIDKDKKAEYSYLKASESPGKTKDMGKVHYNVPLKKDGGDTAFKKTQSFTAYKG